MANDDVVYDPRDLNIDARMMAAVMDIGASLEKLYPGWGWIIEPDKSVLKVVATRCNPQYGFYLTDRSMEGASWSKATVMRMAGELLERFGMPRTSFEKAISTYLSVKRATRHPYGWLIPDQGGIKLEHSTQRRDNKLRGIR